MSSAPTAPRHVVVLLTGVGLLLGVSVLLAGVWFYRGAVGQALVTDYLRRRGVPAVVDLSRLDARGVEGTITAGPPSAPTFSVRHFIVEFAPLSGLTAPRVERVTLDGAKLRLGYDGRKLDFGPLQRLLDEAAHTQPSSGPAPDLVLRRGELELTSPFGPLSATVDAEFRVGGLTRAVVMLRPAGLAEQSLTVKALEGRLVLHGAGGASYRGELQLRAAEARGFGSRLGQPRVQARFLCNWKAGAADPFAGPVEVHAEGSAGSFEGLGARAGPLNILTRLNGVLTGGGAPGFTGRGDTHVDASWAAFANLLLRRPLLDATSGRLELVKGGVTRAGAVAAAFTSAQGELKTGGEQVRLTRLSAAFRGFVGTGRGRGKASLAMSAGLSAPRAAIMARRLAPGDYGRDLRPLLVGALREARMEAPAIDVAAEEGAWSASLHGPALLTEPGGGVLSLSALQARGRGRRVSASAALRLEGGDWPGVTIDASEISIGPAGTAVAFHTTVAGSAGPLRSARLDGAVHAFAGPRAAQATLDRCADVTVGRLEGTGPEPVAERIAARLCPAVGAPLLSLGSTGASLAAQLNAVSARAPEANLAVEGATMAVALAIRGRRLSGEVRIDQATVKDTAAPLRFRPLRISGALNPEGDAWRGGFDVALARGEQPLGRLVVVQDLRTGEGSLKMDAPALVFAPDGLQPAAVVPALAGLGQDVAGAAAADLSLTWRGAETTSLVHASTSGLQIKTAAGLLRGVKTALTFTALDPLTSPPGQRITAERLESIVPATGIEAVVAFGGDTLQVQAADATVAQGRVSLGGLRWGLKPGAPITGVLRVQGVQLGDVLSAFSLSDAVKLDARVSGALPFSLTAEGLRFSDGRLAAQGPGRLTLKRQALTDATASGGASASSTSTVQDFAFQALEDLAFTELQADVGSRARGRLGVVFHIRGRHDPPVGQPARIRLADLLRGQPFARPVSLPKNTEVSLTLDSSLNLDDLLAGLPGLSPPPGSPQVQP